VCRTAGTVFTVENRCSHNGSPLAGGRIRGHTLSCPVHGAKFDLRDGSTAGALTKTPIRTFPVEVANGVVFIHKEAAGQREETVGDVCFAKIMAWRRLVLHA